MSNDTEKFKEKIYNLMIGAFDLEHYPIQESQFVANEYEEGKFCEKATVEFANVWVPMRTWNLLSVT